MKKVWYPLAAASLLLLAGPATAGNDFCDSTGSMEIEPGYNGGGCEVNLMVTGADLNTGTSERPDERPLRMHDLPFDSGLYLRLAELRKDRIAKPDDVYFWAFLSQTELGSQADTHTEAGLVEWSFRGQDKGGANAEYILVLSVLRKDTQLRLNGEWIPRSAPGWSYAGYSGPPPVLADNQFIVLGEIGERPRVDIHRKGNLVSVRLAGSDSQWMQFTLPSGQWAPVRLRNGLVNGTPLTIGMGAHLIWPGEFADPDSDPEPVPGPGEAPVGPPESPQPILVQ